MRVRVYRNLHTGKLSLQEKTNKGWRVSAHVENVELKNCKFTVQPAGRNKVRKERRKNVHAWIEGDLVSLHSSVPLYEHYAVYNPYKNDKWRDSVVGWAVDSAEHVSVFSNGKVTYENLLWHSH